MVLCTLLGLYSFQVHETWTHEMKPCCWRKWWQGSCWVQGFQKSSISKQFSIFKTPIKHSAVTHACVRFCSVYTCDCWRSQYTSGETGFSLSCLIYLTQHCILMIVAWNGILFSKPQEQSHIYARFALIYHQNHFQYLIFQEWKRYSLSALRTDVTKPALLSLKKIQNTN